VLIIFKWLSAIFSRPKGHTNTKALGPSEPNSTHSVSPESVTCDPRWRMGNEMWLKRVQLGTGTGNGLLHKTGACFCFGFGISMISRFNCNAARASGVALHGVTYTPRSEITHTPRWRARAKTQKLARVTHVPHTRNSNTPPSPILSVL